jgi:riboflavin kinase/FMN adenylyltransferase
LKDEGGIFLQIHAASHLCLPASVLTIGALDGIHAGHQKLIYHARERAASFKVPLVVYTFDPPPRVYFQHTLLLTPLVEKLERLEALGVDHVIVASFDAVYIGRGVGIFLNELSALNPKEIWVGSDFRFGSNRDGDIHALAESFTVRILDPVRCSSGKIISSSRIRMLLTQGARSEAQELLGWS